MNQILPSGIHFVIKPSEIHQTGKPGTPLLGLSRTQAKTKGMAVTRASWTRRSADCRLWFKENRSWKGILTPGLQSRLKDEVFTEYGKIYRDDWKRHRGKTISLSHICLLKNLYVNVLHRIFQKALTSQHAQTKFTLFSKPPCPPRIPALNCIPQNKAETAPGWQPPCPLHQPPHASASLYLPINYHIREAHSQAPPPASSLVQEGQLSGSLTSAISKWVFTEPPHHQPFPLFVFSPLCQEITF